MESLICIDGVVGAGKTTLGDILCQELGFHFFEEPVDNNPLLAKFYHDQQRYSFSMQVYFLNKRFRMLKQASALSETCLMDRSIYGDVIFARLLMLQGKMSAEEFDLYEELLFNMLEHVMRPRLMVYLKIDVDAAISRIQSRGRDFEQQVPREYWELLNQEYEKYFDSYNFSDLLVIDVNDIDVRKPGAARSLVIDKITERLAMPLANL
ncbi:MAG: deoxynucleoside kinase [Bernardetiaceae bacterium]|nr:deoxynucleoside kinase [Bernardetiaceae bacterium]